MVVNVSGLREIHNLGPATREWVVSTTRAPEHGPAHTRFVGYTVARADYAFVRHDPAFSMLLLSTSGEGDVLVDNRWRPCPAGFAYLTAPRTLHAYHISRGGRWQVHWVIYNEQARLPTLPPGTPPRLVSVEGTGLRHAVEGLCHEQLAKPGSDAIELWGALVDRMVGRILQPDGGDPRLERLWLAVRTDIGGEWTLARMAKLAAMSEESLRRLCQLQHGIAPMTCVTRFRMQLASDILLHSGEKLAAIAARLGYSDAFAFSTAFKRIIGQSPQQFREKAQRR